MMKPREGRNNDVRNHFAMFAFGRPGSRTVVCIGISGSDLVLCVTKA